MNNENVAVSLISAEELRIIVKSNVVRNQGTIVEAVSSKGVITRHRSLVAMSKDLNVARSKNVKNLEIGQSANISNRHGES